MGVAGLETHWVWGSARHARVHKRVREAKLQANMDAHTAPLPRQSRQVSLTSYFRDRGLRSPEIQNRFSAYTGRFGTEVQDIQYNILKNIYATTQNGPSPLPLDAAGSLGPPLSDIARLQAIGGMSPQIGPMA